MASITYRIGDLLRAKEILILHGCNARGKMKSGIARQIRAQFPAAYRDYLQAFETDGLRLGQCIWSLCDERVIIISGITQANYGRDPTVVYADYNAIAEVMRAVEEDAEGRAVAMPLIGAGLANGDWRIISRIIERESKTFQPVVYLHDAEWVPFEGRVEHTDDAITKLRTIDGDGREVATKHVVAGGQAIFLRKGCRILTTSGMELRA